MGLLQGAASRGEPFDLALIGKSLPAMSGVELGQIIRGTPEAAEVNLVLTTPLVDRDQSEGILGAGMDAHLTKPARQAALLTKIAELARRRVEPAAIQPTVDILRPKAQVVSLERARQAYLLLAEDSKVNQVVALATLEKEGYRVDAVSYRREAVEAIQAHSYDLVLMDASMPEMDGFDATTAIRRLPSEVSRIPIIVMTTHAIEGDREQCLQAGMNDYVSKPVNRRGLLDTVGCWLGGWPKDAGVGAPVAASAPAARPAEQASRGSLVSTRRADEPRRLAAIFAPPPHELGFDIEEVEHPAEGLVDDVLDCPRRRVEGGDGRKHDRPHLAQAQHGAQMAAVVRRLAHHHDQPPTLLEDHVGGARQQVRGDPRRDLGHASHRTGGDDHAEGAIGPASNCGADVLDRVGRIGERAHPRHLVPRLVAKGHLGRLGHDQVRLDQRFAQDLEQPDAVGDP
jgi:CheY-like chemotaxis protein